MLGITELKTGTVFEDEGQPWMVLEYQHSKMGRGGAVLKTKVKNLMTGSIVNKTYQGSDKFEGVQLERKKAQYLYEDEAGYVFMDEATYEQFTIDKVMAGETPKYVKEGESIQLQLYKGKPINLDLPIKVKLRVAEAPQGERGNTATGATKPITLETGLVVQAPLFIKEGDMVVIDTRSGVYVERAN